MNEASALSTRRPPNQNSRMQNINPTPSLSSQNFSLVLPVASLRRFRSVLRTGTIHEIEKALRQLWLTIILVVQELLVEELKQRDQLLARSPCPGCGRLMHFNRHETRTFQFLEGEVSLLRSYLECRPCSIHMHPLDLDLNVPEIGEITPQFGHDLSLLGAELPCKAGARVLQTLTQRRVHPGLIHDQVQRDGEALVALEREEAEALWPYDSKGNLRDIESLTSLPRLRNPPPPDPEGAIVIEIDGAMVNLGADPEIKQEFESFQKKLKEAVDRGESLKGPLPSSFREARQMRIYRLKDLVIKKTKKGKERRSLSQSETVTVVNDPVFFEMRVNAVCRAWRVDEYRDRVVLGDGGSFIWKIAKDLIVPTREILDSRHARSHIHDCANALFSGSSDESKQWAKKWSQHVKENGPAALQQELQRLRSQTTWSDEGQRKLDNLVEYVTEHQSRMHYPTFKEGGLPIASGAIESANRQVVGDRCKRSGMRWARASLQRLLSLRASLLSGNWESACQSIRARRCIHPILANEGNGQPVFPSNLSPHHPDSCPSPPPPSPLPGPPSQSRAHTPSKPAPKPLQSNRTLARLDRSNFVMPENT